MDTRLLSTLNWLEHRLRTAQTTDWPSCGGREAATCLHELVAAQWDDREAITYLEGRGYKLLRSWDWRKPSPDFVPSAVDRNAIDYLFREWDFGGLEA